MASIVTTAKLIELVQQADGAGGVFVRVLSSTRLVLGKDPMNPTLAIDLSSESVSSYRQEESKINGFREATPSHDVVEKARSTRQSGHHWLERACTCAELRCGYELKTSISESASDVQKVSATHEDVFGSH